LDSFIIFTGANKKQGPLSLIILFVKPYAAAGDAAAGGAAAAPAKPELLGGFVKAE